MLNARTIQPATDAPYYPAKTPAASARNRRENVYQGAMTVHTGKAKNANLLRTPFQPKSAQPQRLAKDLHLKAPPIQLVITNQSKPLADKTPFVNRILDGYKTPGPAYQHLKPLDLDTTAALEAPAIIANPTPGSARASSTRKHTRLPKPQAYHDFQTPANIGNHWDISDGDIAVPEEINETEKETEEEPLDFNDEIEYMAPNTSNLQYQPPFDFELPNYRLLGQDVLHKLYSYPEEQTALSPPSFEFTFKDDEFMKWDNLFLPPLSPSDDAGKHSGARTRRNSKQSHLTRISTSTTMKKPAGSNRSVSAMNLRPKSTALASIRPNRPASSISLKPPPNSSSGAAKPKTRTSSTKINMTSTSSRMAPKPATTSGISTKTKPKQPTVALANTKATTSTKRVVHSTSNIPRPSSTLSSMRPASAIGVNDAIHRATNATTVKRPSTSTSVIRPKPQALSTRSSSSTSVQRGMNSNLRTTRVSAAATTLNIKADKLPPASSSGAKPMMKGRTNSIPLMKGKVVSSNDLATKSGGIISSKDAGAVPDGMTKVKEKMDGDATSQSPGIDTISAEHIEIKVKKDQSDCDEEDDDDEYDDEETIRLVVPVKKPEIQDTLNSTYRQKEMTNQLSFFRDPNTTHVAADNIINQSTQIEVGEGRGADLSVVEEITEVSISFELVDKMEVLKLE